MMQKTLRRAFRFEGVGLHTGKHATVEVAPAPPDTGIVFDLAGESRRVRVPALSEFVTDTSRATVLGDAGASVSTTEHLLAALYASGIANAIIAVEGPEIPIADGSAREFVDAIERAGVKQQDRRRAVVTVDEPFVVQSGDRLVAMLPSPAFRVRFVADFPPPIGTQYYYGEIGPEQFRDEIAGARTFGYLHEVEALRARGLALGGSLDNALVFAPEGPMQTLRWPNEVVRHKVLDLVGDLALLGTWPLCEVVAIKS
ncbi:MAG: UDP-3-O-[3-hydroxymyristoyl] N-acetylglucosamine deacetylase, partial [Candidatus Eremiobacteraeota bacterium]|nr:UDP-3-O-[3-hydroxymyristoyl] N-acetylglucosamine deacetylase [Candidatus Eremiobacteraeota bacterium]